MNLPENTHIGNSYVIGTEDGDGFDFDISFAKIQFSDEYIPLIDTCQNIILATGSFGVDITLPEIEFLDEKLAILSTFDTTNAIRIEFDVRLFNEKINLYKDESNVIILDSSFNSSTGRFPALSIQFDFNDFKNNISPDQILSLGSFKNVYTDFTFQVKKYFHFPRNFDLFNRASITAFNNNIFDSSEFIRSMSDKVVDVSGNVVNAFSGYFSIYGINRILIELVKNDIFSNRISNNYTEKDGFIAGDKILIIPGITFDMGVVINNPYSIDIQELSLLSQQSYDTSESTNKFLQKQYRAPILLELNNLS